MAAVLPLIVLFSIASVLSGPLLETAAAGPPWRCCR